MWADWAAVPKTVQLVVDVWCPSAYVVTFKLETDAAMLLPKARAALDHYRHRLGAGLRACGCADVWQWWRTCCARTAHT